MKQFISRSLTPSMIVAMLALLVALGGVSYAATVLPRNSVGTLQLKTDAVTGAKVKANAIGTGKVLNHSLLAVDFKSGQLPKGPKGPVGATGPAGPAGAPGLAALQTVSGTAATGTGAHSVTATCPTGKKAISGGWNDAGVDSSSAESITFAAISDDGNSFRVDGKLSSGSDSWSLTARVLCATVAS